MTLRVKNWQRFQHFSDRRPLWIKLYRDLLEDIEWHELDPEACKALVMLWLIASENGGLLPPIKTLAFRLRKSESEVKSIVSKLGHWLEHPDIESISSGYQIDTLEKRREQETSNKKENKREEVESPSGDPPLTEAFDAYNLVAKKTGLPEARVLTPERRKKLRARLLEHGIGGWMEALAAIERQPFLLGQNKRGWRISFGFLLKTESLNKVREGAYADKQISRFAVETDELIEWAKDMDQKHGRKALSDFSHQDGERGIGQANGCAPLGHGNGSEICITVACLDDEGAAPGRSPVEENLQTPIGRMPSRH